MSFHKNFFGEFTFYYIVIFFGELPDAYYRHIDIRRDKNIATYDLYLKNCIYCFDVFVNDVEKEPFIEMAWHVVKISRIILEKSVHLLALTEINISKQNYENPLSHQEN